MRTILEDSSGKLTDFLGESRQFRCEYKPDGKPLAQYQEIPDATGKFRIGGIL
jgi:hypothetical protein